MQHSVITGPSGSGKSTLLQCLGLIDQCTYAHFNMLGQNIMDLSASKLTELRKNHLGFIYQEHHLFNELNVFDNIALPLMIQNITPSKIKAQTSQILNDIGLLKFAQQNPATLSGGQKQRVAIARAMVKRPSIVLADEPTGQLDGQTANHVIDLIFNLAEQYNTTVIAVTHDPKVANRFDRHYHLNQSLESYVP